MQIASWAETSSGSDLCRLQKKDPDIGPILDAKITGNKPSSHEMVTRSPVSRQYWILWDSRDKMVSFARISFKTDGSGEYLQILIPSAMKEEILF